MDEHLENSQTADESLQKAFQVGEVLVGINLPYFYANENSVSSFNKKRNECYTSNYNEVIKQVNQQQH